MKKESIVIVGKGRWGKILTPYISKFFNITDQFGCDPIKWGELLVNKAIKNIVIVTPPETHYSLVKQALEANKNIFCEKPLCLKHEQVSELEELSKSHKIKLIIDYTNTFSTSLKYCLKYIKNKGKEIEKINIIIWKKEKKVTDSNPNRICTALGCHAFSILDMFINILGEDFFLEKITNKNKRVFFSERSSISIDLNANKCFIVQIFTKDNFITYNPFYIKKPLIIKNRKNKELFYLKQDERNNLLFAVSYFKDVLENKASSNIETEKRISKILERYY